MKYLVYLFSKVILASYIFLWPTLAFENDSVNEQDYLNIPPYYQKIWEDFYETNQVTDSPLTPSEAYSLPAVYDNFLPFTEVAYELEENNLYFSEYPSSMVPDYIPRTETAPGAPPPTEHDLESRGTETTAPCVELFPELWLQILECTYYDEASQRQRSIAYYAGSVSKTLEKLRREMKSLMITISKPSRMKYYLTAPQNMFLCVNVECSVTFSQLAKLAILTPNLYVLRLANIQGINIPEAQKDGISRLSQLQQLSIRLTDPSGKTWPIVGDTNKARLMQLVSLSTLQLLDLNDYTYVPIVQGSRKLNLSNISTLKLDLSNTSSFDLQELVYPGLTNLQRLRLIGLSVRLENVSVLAQLTSLQDLEIRGYDYRNLLQDLPPLNLTSLRLSLREINNPMLPSISKLQNLRLLDFNYADYGSFHPSDVAQTFLTSLQLVRNLKKLYLPKPYHNRPIYNLNNVWDIPFTESEKAQEASRLESLIGKPGLQVFFHDNRELPTYFI